MDRSFLKHALVYGLATLLTQAAGFILLPVYLRCLGKGDYGVLEVVGRLAEIVGMCLLFGGFRQALLTLHQQAEEELARRRVICAAYLLVLGSCLLGGITALALGPRLGSLLTPGLAGEGAALTPTLVRLAVLGILLEPLTLIPLALLQARMESTGYILVVVGQFLARVTLTILLVRFFAWGVAGALTATALTGALFGLTLTARELGRGLAWPGLSLLRELIAFALPLLPGGLCFLVLHAGDRFFLARYGSAADVGIYALGYKLALLVAIFSLNPLYMVWSSHLYAVARSASAADIFGEMFTRILAAFLFVGLALCLFREEVVQLLGGKEYREAAHIVPPVVLACFFQAASSLMDAGLYVRRRTGVKLAVTLASALVMLMLYALLIPAHAAAGAAAATLAGFAFLAAATYAVSQRLFPVRYEWGRLAALVGLTVGLWFIGCLVPSGAMGFTARVGLWLAAPPLAWCCGLVRRDEKRHVQELLAGLLFRLRGQPGEQPQAAA